MNLQATWYVLIGILIAGYAALDGFDLGVGILYPFIGKTDGDRGVLRRAIGPFWDGNEVWLLTAGGALFAAFPPVYATVFSGFYLALMLVLFALIFRAVSVEARGQDKAWARFWDWAFFLGSLLPGLLLGVAVGNIVRGVPINAQGDFGGTFFTLLNPYALLVGLVGLAAFIAHGASWIVLRAEGDLRTRADRVRSLSQWVLVGLIIVLTVATAIAIPARLSNGVSSVIGWIMIVVLVAGMVFGRVAIARRQDFNAFLASAVTMVGLIGLGGAGNFPKIVPAISGLGHDLTAYNSSSSHLTLTVMLIVALIGVPLVLAYTIFVYRTFWGKVGGTVAESEGY